MNQESCAGKLWGDSTPQEEGPHRLPCLWLPVCHGLSHIFRCPVNVNILSLWKYRGRVKRGDYHLLVRNPTDEHKLQNTSMKHWQKEKGKWECDVVLRKYAVGVSKALLFHLYSNLGHVYTGAALLKTEMSFLCIFKICLRLHEQPRTL